MDHEDGRRHAARDAVGRIPDAVTSEIETARRRASSPEEAAETVEALVGLGIARDEAQRAVEDDRVTVVLLRHVLGEPEVADLATVAREADVPIGVLRTLREANVLGGGEGNEIDVEMARLLHVLLDTVSVEALIRSVRTRRVLLSQMVVSDLAMLHQELIVPLRERGADDLTVAMALAEAADELMPVAGELLELGYRQALRHVLSTEVVAAAARRDAPDLELTIGFVDLVGYSSLSNRIDPTGIDHVLDVFEDHVHRVLAGREDVGVVKFLGDAVMLVSHAPLAMADAMFALTREVQALDDAPLRGGFAAGRTIIREGDYFGPAVNLAARLTDVARPWSVIADEALEQAVATRYETSRLRSLRLRGFDSQRPVRLVAPRDDVWAEPDPDASDAA